MAKPRCTAKTKKGKRCRAAPLKSGDTCLAHSDADTRASVRFTPEAGHQGGRPPLPKPHELMRQRIEENIERILAPYFAAIDEAVLTANFMGEVTVSDVADLGARIAAAEKLLDRVYGKPRQVAELTGEGGGPIEVAGELADPEVREAMFEVMRRVGAARER